MSIYIEEKLQFLHKGCAAFAVHGVCTKQTGRKSDKAHTAHDVRTEATELCPRILRSHAATKVRRVVALWCTLFLFAPLCVHAAPAADAPRTTVNNAVNSSALYAEQNTISPALPEAALNAEPATTSHTQSAVWHDKPTLCHARPDRASILQQDSRLRGNDSAPRTTTVQLTTQSGIYVAQAFSDDELFGGAPSLYNDDELFGGTSNFSSDDDLFGGSSNFTSDDDLFGGSSSFSSDDDLFGGADDFSSDDAFFDDMISDVDITSTQNDVSAADAIFDAGTIRAGGAFATTSTLSAVWYNPFKPNTVKRDYIKDGFEHTAFQPTFDSYIYLDARPTTNFRVYTKLKFDFPPPPLYPFLSYDEHPKWQMCECNVKLFELFADFSLLDRAFFRFGKHTVTWGVGYFFSPADVINLSAIDIANPTEQREGAVSLRTQVIFPGTQNCLWLYLLPDKDSDKDDDEYDAELKYTALAAKYEFLLKNYELGLGAWYQYGRTPRLVATVTGPLKNAAVFAEGVLGYGTEAQWAPLGKTAKKNAEKAHTSAPAIQYRDMKPVFQGTVGASYTWSRQKVTLIGQYFYNGFGSKEAKKLSPAAFLDLQNTYNYSGRHYLAASLSKSELFTRDLSASLFALVSLDGFYDFFSRKYEDAPLPASLDFKGFSGMVQGTLNYTFADKFTLSTGPVLTFGKEGTEFTRVGGYPAKSTLVWRLSLKLDAGKY